MHLPGNLQRDNLYQAYGVSRGRDVGQLQNRCGYFQRTLFFRTRWGSWAENWGVGNHWEGVGPPGHLEKATNFLVNLCDPSSEPRSDTAGNDKKNYFRLEKFTPRTKGGDFNLFWFRDRLSPA